MKNDSGLLMNKLKWLVKWWEEITYLLRTLFGSNLSSKDVVLATSISFSFFNIFKFKFFSEARGFGVLGEKT